MADVIPGISGGTLALLFGIYHRLIEAIKSFDKIWLQGLIKLDMRIILQHPHFTFLIPLGIGILLALFFFTRIIPLPMLLQRYPEIIYGLFFGLIGGSTIILMQQVKIYSFKKLRFVIAGIAIGYMIFTAVPVNTPTSEWFIFCSGILAIAATLMPGISGSFILLMLKKYTYIFTAIGQLNLTVLIPLALGIMTGLVLFSRILSWLLKNWSQETMATMVGLLIASLYVIWPFQQRVYETIQGKETLIKSLPYLPQQLTMNVSLSISIMIIGLLVTLAINYMATKQVAFTRDDPEK